ncbi:MAG: NAD-binding protein [Candidatus Latescibacteria bacterium]|nr:NAD-binding protein [Candidatus Latescibacterota bacterium]MCK5328173.1 NAD-binding protein [Candidatus Latescibacterota bacterium]MCK5527473.1 NAD-binding protein [Candidatus Latescibacterota bacterium]
MTKERSKWRLPRKRFRKGFRRLKRAVRFLWETNIPRLAVLLLVVMFVGATTVGIIEHTTGARDQFGSLSDAVWWALVTISTVGYGDKVPVTGWGRILTGVLIFAGMGCVSILTATIASVMTARRIKEGRGLEQINFKGHTVICGWNRNVERVIEGIIQGTAQEMGVVLINEMPEEVINEMLFKFRDTNIKYVRGDFVQESVLRRANLSEAHAAIILADEREGQQGNADDRTILATLTIKSIEPEVKVCAELLDAENEPHLRRADADEVITSGAFSGFLLANAAVAPGVTQAIQELLTHDLGNKFWSAQIPSHYVDRTFGELSDYFRKTHQAILIGLVREERGMGLDDILTDDYSSIDQFIREQFDEAGKNVGTDVGGRIHLTVNPDDEAPIGEQDQAIIIAQQRIES